MLNFFKSKEETYLGWNEYKNKIEFLDMFNWQQSVRRQSIKNL